MPKAICTKCNVSLKPETNGVLVAEMMKDDTEIYKIWEADLWKCPGCGITIVLGFAVLPLAEHFEKEKMERALAHFKMKCLNGEGYVWNERLGPIRLFDKKEE